MLRRKAHTGTDAYTPTPGLVAHLEAILTTRVKPYAVKPRIITAHPRRIKAVAIRPLHYR